MKLYESEKDVLYDEDGRPIPDGWVTLYLYSPDGSDKPYTVFMKQVKFLRDDEVYGFRLEFDDRREIYPWGAISTVILKKNSKFYIDAIKEWRRKRVLGIALNNAKPGEAVDILLDDVALGDFPFPETDD